MDPTQEQQPPVKGMGDVWLLVLQDMEARRLHGIEKYGTPVQPHNGRDPLVDAYQESLDQCVYLRQAIEEIGTLKDEAERMRAGLMRIRKSVEDGQEWCKMDAGSLHLIVTRALGES